MGESGVGMSGDEWVRGVGEQKSQFESQKCVACKAPRRSMRLSGC